MWGAQTPACRGGKKASRRHPCCSSLPYHIQRYSHCSLAVGPSEMLATQLRQKIHGNLKFLSPGKALSTSRHWDFASPSCLSQYSASALSATQTPCMTPIHKGELVGKCADTGIDHLQGRTGIVLHEEGCPGVWGLLPAR